MNKRQLKKLLKVRWIKIGSNKWNKEMMKLKILLKRKGIDYDNLIYLDDEEDLDRFLDETDKQTLIQRNKIWAETFDGITWQIYEIDDDKNINTIGEIYFIDGDWIARCTLPKTCIISDGKTPEEALDSFIDLYYF